MFTIATNNIFVSINLDVIVSTKLLLTHQPTSALTGVTYRQKKDDLNRTFRQTPALRNEQRSKSRASLCLTIPESETDFFVRNR